MIIGIEYTKGGYVKANGFYITKQTLSDFEQVGDSSCFYKKHKCITLRSYAKNYLTQMQIDIANGEDGVIDCWRNPTKAEIKFGYGAIHSGEAALSLWLKKDGTLKKRIKLDGIWYNRH